MGAAIRGGVVRLACNCGDIGIFINHESRDCLS